MSLGRLLWSKCCFSPLCVSRCALLGLISKHFAMDKDELMVQQASISIPCIAYELLIHEHFVAGIHYLVYESSKQQVTSLGMNQILEIPGTALCVEKEQLAFTVHGSMLTACILLHHLLQKSTKQFFWGLTGFPLFSLHPLAHLSPKPPSEHLCHPASLIPSSCLRSPCSPG